MLRATICTTFLLLVCAFLSWIGLFDLARACVVRFALIYRQDPVWFTVWMVLLLFAAKMIVTILTRGGAGHGPRAAGEQ